MFKLCLLILLSTVGLVYSAVAIYPYEPKPAEFADQEGCYIQDLNRVLPYEIPYYPKDGETCLKYTCGKNNETQLVSCGALGYPDTCHLEYDYTLDYPKCCGTLVCDQTTTTEEPTTTETTTTEATCVTVTEEPVCEDPTPPQKPKSPKRPKAPEEPKAPKSPKIYKITISVIRPEPDLKN